MKEQLPRGKHLPPSERMGKGRQRHPGIALTGEHQPRPVRKETPRATIRNRRRWILMSLYLALAVELVAALLTAPILAIRRVEVTGLQGLPEAERVETLQALTVPRATNWFLTPVARLHTRTRSLPWVRVVLVRRDFTRTLHATITPRVPMFAITEGTQTFEADSDGIPIRTLREEMHGRLPEIEIPMGHSILPGRSVATLTVQAAIRIFRETEHEKAIRISKIVIDQNDNLCLNMLDGIRLKLGPPDKIDAKIAQMQKIYAKDSAVGTSLAVINLSYPSKPACTPRLAAIPPTSGTSSDALQGPTLPASNVIP